MKETNILVDHTLVEKIRRIASALGVSFDALVRMIVHHHVITSDHEGSNHA